MNIVERKDRKAFLSQKPYRAPWIVICVLAACIAFLVGHVVGNFDASSAEPMSVNDSLRGNDHNSTIPKLTTRRAAALPALGGLSANPVADIVSSAEPSVVSIDTTIREDRSSISLPDLLFNKSGKVPKKNRENYEAHGAGSGILVRSDGYVMTNYHVVKGANDIKVTLNDGRRFKGTVVGHDGYTDVALVKIDINNVPVAKLGSSKEVRPGDWAIAIGSPLGLSHTVTMGIVSAVGRSLADLNNNIDLIQTDAAINPGNSGGPLLNIRGEVVGINMAIRTDAQNIGFSIPIDIAREAATAIIEHRPVVRPYLGLSMIDLDADLVRTLGLSSSDDGALVSKVASQSPAAVSGIIEGDVIESINSAPVRNSSDVQRLIRGQKVGNQVQITVIHNGKVKVVNVTLLALPGDQIVS